MTESQNDILLIRSKSIQKLVEKEIQIALGSQYDLVQYSIGK